MPEKRQSVKHVLESGNYKQFQDTKTQTKTQPSIDASQIDKFYIYILIYNSRNGRYHTYGKK